MWGGAGTLQTATRERTRVLFVLGSMAGGGAERIVAHLVKHLNRDEFDARAGLLWRHGDYLDQFEDSELVVTRLAHGWIPYRDQPRWWQLLPSLALVPLQQREIVRRFRPHIVVTVTKSMNIAARFSLAFAGRRDLAWVVREGNNTGAMIDDESPGGFLRALQNFAVTHCVPPGRSGCGDFRRCRRRPVASISPSIRSASRRFTTPWMWPQSEHGLKKSRPTFPASPSSSRPVALCIKRGSMC